MHTPHTPASDRRKHRTSGKDFASSFPTLNHPIPSSLRRNRTLTLRLDPPLFPPPSSQRSGQGA